MTGPWALNGSFLGIDDLYRRSHPLPGAYRAEAERLVALKTTEFLGWLRSASPTCSRRARERDR